MRPALLGERVDAAGAVVLYQESGGNPFYLEQLARPPERGGGRLLLILTDSASRSHRRSPPR